MSEITINERPDLLFNKLETEFGSRLLKNIEIPKHISSNINSRFPLRPYQEKSFKAFILYLEESFDFKEHPPHVLFNMATGSGKTLIMAGCILHLYNKGYRNFLFFSTSNPIIEKTKDNFTQTLSNKYLFNEHIEIENKQINIRQVENFEESNDEDINIKFTTIHKLHGDLRIDKENSLTIDSLKNQKIVLIGDEAHHFNKATNQQLEFKEIIKDDKNWESTIQKILSSNKNNLLLEYTATIDWQNENTKNKYLPKCLIKYDLSKFREDGYSKEIKLFQSDKGIEKKDLILQSIILNQFRQDIATDNNINFKPVILFKANKTINESKENQEFFNKLISKLTEEDIKKLNRFSLKSEKVEYDKSGYFADNNYLIEAFKYYNNKCDGFVGLVRKLKLNFAENKCLNVNEYAFEGKKQSTKKFEKFQDETSVQEDVLNSLEDINNEIRAIFAVNKLNEGWDVLNLFDIVRLYDTRDTDTKSNKVGKTTTAEVQLIGRGARYFPFSKDLKNKYQRKFDDNIKSPLRLLETLHYHSIYNSRYISELKSELVKTGAMEDTKVVKTLNIKDDFKTTDLFKHGLVYVNEAQKTNYGIYKAWDNMPIIKGNTFEYSIFTGFTKEELAFDNKVKQKDNLAKKESIFYSISEISNNVKFNALLDTPFFEFNNLKKYIKDISTIEDFIYGYLNTITISLKGYSQDIRNVSIGNQYKALRELLSTIRNQLKGNITEYKGSTNFIAKPINQIFKDDKPLSFKKGNSRLANDMIEFVKDKDWYVYNAVYGTSEEKSFLEMFENFINELQKKYSEIKLIRNERDLCIFDFDEGRRFEPDFVLILKNRNDKVMNYQVFIEPKGDHLKNNDLEKWKVKFLDDIRQMHKGDGNFINYNKDKKYKLIGLPFYNNKDEAEFRNTIIEELL